MDDLEFFSRVEGLVRRAELSESYRSNKELEWDTFLEPLLCLISKFVNSGGQQDPAQPGKIRIDMGRPLPHGGLQPNPDTVLVIDFDCGENADSLRVFAKYNLADELLRYAEVGEEGWDVRRQIYQLERTIERLRDGASSRGWHIPDLSPGTVFVN